MSWFDLSEDEEFGSLRGSVSLRRVPLPLPGVDRFLWRILSVLAALTACRGSAASVEQLHTLVWALRSEENARTLESAWNGQAAGVSAFRGYEPDLMASLRVAQADGLIRQAGTGRQELTDSGRAVLTAFNEAGGTLGPQQEILYSLSPITAAGMWRSLGGATR